MDRDSWVYIHKGDCVTTGYWCEDCGAIYGVVKILPMVRDINYEIAECDGCGVSQFCVPAWNFKISVFAARQAIKDRLEKHREKVTLYRRP
jgi:hypothetical protein